MIDMHAHWRPAEVIDALRSRTREPRIVRNGDGVEVLKTRNGEEPLSEAFDNAEDYLARMDRQGVSTSVLSLLGSFCWVEGQPLDVSVALCRLVNEALDVDKNEAKETAKQASQDPVGTVKDTATETAEAAKATTDRATETPDGIPASDSSLASRGR